MYHHAHLVMSILMPVLITIFVVCFEIRECESIFVRDIAL
jgi:hypothetical protein